MASKRIDPAKRDAAATEMLHLIAQMAQIIVLYAELDSPNAQRVLGEACSLLNRVGGDGFADACGEDASLCAP